MSGNGHNKKRNSGLLYEFLVRSISGALVDDDQKRSASALKILKRHFKPGTELYKEFRLVNSLVRTTVSSEAVAVAIINEARVAARSHNITELDREKSLLIRNINHALNDNNFYDQQVGEYRAYATVQMLLNDWRLGTDADLGRVAQYEDQLVKLLTSPKTPSPVQALNGVPEGTNRLFMKMMMQKLNERYAGVLNEAQKSIIRTYVWSLNRDGGESIKQKLHEVRSSLLKSIDDFSKDNSDSYINPKLAEVRSTVDGEQLTNIDDDTVTRFMLYIKLNNELVPGGNNV